jgi:hypothetical protein
MAPEQSPPKTLLATTVFVTLTVEEVPFTMPPPLNVAMFWATVTFVSETVA